MKHVFTTANPFVGCIIVVLLWGWSSGTLRAQRSQPLSCGTTATPEEIQRAEARYRDIVKQYRMGSGRVAAGITYLPIRFTFIVATRATSVDDISSYYGKAMDQIILLNRSFLPIGIQFYLTSDPFPQIVNPGLVEFNGTDDNIAFLLKSSAQDAINVYVANSVYDSKGKKVGGFARYPTQSKSSNLIVVAQSSFTDVGLLSHEMGHFFNLYHTFENSNATNVKDRELVNGSNCTTTGDLLCDTPADPYDRLSGKFEENCEYYATVRDANGDTYKPMMDNFMSYFQSCTAFRFTKGQYDRMKSMGQVIRLNQNNEYKFTHPPLDDALLALTFTKVRSIYNASPSASHGNVKISWSGTSDQQNGYIIERSETPDANFVAVGTLTNGNEKTKEWEDTGADYYKTFKRYYYRVRAVNSLNYSNVIQLPELLITANKGGLTGNEDFPVGIALSWSSTGSTKYVLLASDNTAKEVVNQQTTNLFWNDKPNATYSLSNEYHTKSGSINYTVVNANSGIGNFVLAEKGVCFPQQTGCDNPTNTTGIESIQIVDPNGRKVVLQASNICGKQGQNTSYSDLAAVKNIDYTITNGHKFVRGKSHFGHLIAMKILSGSRKDKVNPYYVNIWIDFNNDRVFAENELVIKTGRQTEESVSFSVKIPLDVQTGFCRMRTQLTTSSSLNPCRQNIVGSANAPGDLGEIEDYLVQIVDADTDPVPTLVLSAEAETVYDAGGTGSLRLNANHAWTASSDVAWLSVTPALGSAGAAVAVGYRVDANPAGAARRGSLTFRAGGLSRTFTVTQTDFSQVSSTYCVPVQNYPYNCTSSENTVGLESFTIWSSDKTQVIVASGSVCSQNGYGYSDLTKVYALNPRELDRGKTFPFSVEAMTIQAGKDKGLIYPTRVNIWIDLNRNGLFSDDERLYSSDARWNSDQTDIVGDYPNPLLNARFTIPTTARLGATRLRIRVGVPIVTGLETACESIYGETEDHWVVITDSSVPAAAPAHPVQTSVSDKTTITRGLSAVSRNVQTESANLTDLAIRLQPRHVFTPTEQVNDNSKAGLVVAPNPSSGKIRLILNLDQPSPATIQLIDSFGQNWQNWLLATPDTNHQVETDLSALPAGVYFIKAETGNRRMTQKILKN